MTRLFCAPPPSPLQTLTWHLKAISPVLKVALGAGVYFLINIIISWFMAKDQNGIQVANASGDLITVPANTENIPAYLLRPDRLNEGATYRKVPKKAAPIWPMDSYVDIVVTVSPSFVPASLSDVSSEMVVLDEKRFKMGDYNDKRSIASEFAVPKDVQNNGTLWGHFFVGLHGSQLDPTESDYDIGSAYFFSYPLTHYLPKKKVEKTRNLLDDLPPPVEEEKDDDEPVVMANYYHSNTSLSIIPNTGVLDYATQHPAVRHYLHLEVRSPAKLVQTCVFPAAI